MDIIKNIKSAGVGLLQTPSPAHFIFINTSITFIIKTNFSYLICVSAEEVDEATVLAGRSHSSRTMTASSSSASAAGAQRQQHQQQHPSTSAGHSTSTIISSPPPPPASDKSVRSHFPRLPTSRREAASVEAWRSARLDFGGQCTT